MTPQFITFIDFIHMGKHGAYVWSAWILTLLCIVAMIWYAKHSRSQFIRQQQLQSKRMQRVTSQTVK